MSTAFEELDYRATPMGALSLRRRREPRLDDTEVYEVKLGDEFLMSSLFTAGERALATRGLAGLGDAPLAVVVGGLGLGYTAAAALGVPQVAEVLVIEALAPVIDWHRNGLVPLGRTLVADARLRLVCGDFFALAAGADGFDHAAPGRTVDAVLLDIDHSPSHHLDDGHGGFYTPAGLVALARWLRPGGRFAMWSNDPPDAAFEGRLATAFTQVRHEVIAFPNPYSGASSSCTLYLADRGDA
ncbi:MAG: spermidine synthase [Gammaproteobacteria bacterium]